MTVVRDVFVAPDRLHEFVASATMALGLSAADAAIVAASLVEADLRGVHTHGVAALPGYARRLRGGGVNPRPRIAVAVESAATAVIDGDNGLGQVVGRFAMDQAIARAREYGIGSVTARNSSHFGAAAHYASMALAHDMIGFASTSAGNRIAPIGGKTAVVGNNPVAWAIPSGLERPIVLDMAQSVVAAGKLGFAARRGERIPIGWALDRDGKPTDDPVAGAAGLLVPIGGPKGFGSALVVDILCGALSGAAIGRELASPHQPDAPSRLGHFFIAIDVARFVPIDDFKRRVDRMVRDIHESEPTEPGTPLYLPGEIEWRLREERARRGIPLLESVVADLRGLADELGLDAAGLLGV
ncbi:MAG: Ldh family oxidoreductase [Chloroflexota bacterium]|nr:MAG: Ldh family oxidoreductase [Chloroflexota bacterium]